MASFSMDYPLLHFKKLLLIGKSKWFFVVGLVAITHLICQSLMLPYGNALLSLLPSGESPIRQKHSFSSRQSYAKSVILDSNSLLVEATDLTDTSLFVGRFKDAGKDNVGVDIGDRSRPRKMNKKSSLDDSIDDDEPIVDPHVDDELVDDPDVDDEFLLGQTMDINQVSSVQNVKVQEDTLVLEKHHETRHGLSLEQIVKPTNEIAAENISDGDNIMMPDTNVSISNALVSPLVILPQVESSISLTVSERLTSNVSTSSESAFNKSSVGEQIELLPPAGKNIILRSNITTSSNDSTVMTKPVKKKMKCDMPPKSVTTLYEMNRLLVRHRASSRAMRPRWASPRDKEVLAAKVHIENANVVKNDRELYAPLFRNVSMFKRSYELMELTLKVYVYKDGEKPIFHQPILKGLYASEGWFMKLMEANRRLTVKDPRKAHLFYMPFSSRMLEYTLYVRNSHNRTNLRQHLRNYSEKLAAKYPFWNRTGGADHFLVACHDWAPYETRHHMEHCIKALCNADVTAGFKIGRDISLPETYVRSARNPQRDLGGKPPSQRHILAFYAGNMHGYLRTILLEYWKDKDHSMKILGPMPPGVASKMNYIQHMKSSKYCICPKGYEVNSPRVVEAFFYECVPVIISDNFVPPFFEVLNWDAFSVIIAEQDIPNLKDLLLSIPEKKYLELQLGVRKVQQHFLWHAKPLKYDLFHMTLHSIWYNRVFQIKHR